MWLIEKNFIFSKNMLQKQGTYVLSRVPNYKMNLTSAVSADRFRGNIHYKLSIINFNKFSNQVPSSILIRLNSFSLMEFFKKHTYSVGFSSLKNKKKQINSIESNSQFYFLRHKTIRFFLNNSLKRKFYQDFHLISIKKIIKNKAKRKRHAIKRTDKINAVDPIRKFYRLFVRKIFLGKRLNPMKTSLKQRKAQRYKYLFSFRIFRRIFFKKKKFLEKNVRFVKKILYFSHKKLNDECKAFHEFTKINFKRKRFLRKMALVSTGTFIKPHPYTFLTQKTKSHINIVEASDVFTLHNTCKPIIDYLSPTNLNKFKTIYNNSQLLITSLTNITLLKSNLLSMSSLSNVFDIKPFYSSFTTSIRSDSNIYDNLLPDNDLKKLISKNVLNSFKNNFFQENVVS